MKAVGFFRPLPISHPESLVDLSLPEPVPEPRDLVVQVRAVSVNPVDTKRRKGSTPEADEPRVLGWDAAGTVVDTGPSVTLFKPGDEVWYAGSILRQGSNAERQLVDERLVGRKPSNLSFSEAAALPLTGITAWELLFERLGVSPGKRFTGDTLLVVGAAGGVGSILTQLAARLTAVRVIGTASRPETEEWVRALGAYEVLDHRRALSTELQRVGIPAVTYVASLTRTDQHFDEIVKCLAPQGRLGLIDDPPSIDLLKLKPKSLSLHWELMFTRSMFETHDMIAQHALLNELSLLVEAGIIRTTLGEHYGKICAENLKRAHAHVESGSARGKIVLEGF